MAELEGVTGGQADVGAGVNGRQSWGDGAVAAGDVRSTAELHRSGAGDGAHVVGGVAAVRLVAAAREQLGLNLAQLNCRVEEVFELLAGPVGVLRENRLDLVCTESREVHLTNPLPDVGEVVVHEWACVGEGVKVRG